MQRELQETVQMYTAVKQLLKEKEEAIIALQNFDGTSMEKVVITSDEKSQTDDSQVHRITDFVWYLKRFNGNIVLKYFGEDCK